MQAGGNDFVVLDNRKSVLTDRQSVLTDRKKNLPKNYSKLAKRLCANKFSIGADGLLILENSKRGNAHFRMLYFNADGSEASFCGNGASCLSLFAYEKKIAPARMNFLSKSGIVSAIVEGKKVKLKMPNPRGLNLDFSLDVDGKTYLLSFLDTGVPHTVNFVPDIEKTDVRNLGRKIRYHQFFKPEGTNVDFVQVKDRKTILIRTYERGVENETLSCGTGVVASAIITGVKNLVSPPVNILTRSGEILKVYYQLKSEKYEISRGVYPAPFKNEIASPHCFLARRPDSRRETRGQAKARSGGRNDKRRCGARNDMVEVYLENSPKIVFAGQVYI
jgi:diaminopimelate epimerase